MIYEYWTNDKTWHDKLLLVVEAENITEADKKFQAETGLDPKKGGIGLVLR
jgi:hypothetical protein